MKKIRNYILFAVGFLLLGFLLIFYLDLANGPKYFLFLEIAILVIAIIYRISVNNRKLVYRFLTFIIIIGLNIPIFMFAKPKVEVFKATTSISETSIMHLANGDVIGTYNEDNSVRIYTGIPYAKAPVGELRFKEPQDLENWQGTLDCTRFAPRAMQVDQAPVVSSVVTMYAEKGWHPNYNMDPRQNMSEDCLYLNIWRPNNNETNLPILVYIHGGSLTSGSSAFGDYNGETYAKNGVIMITIAYRLGVFGYFAHEDLANESPNHTTGNYGLLDQIKALKWVNDNAEYFGGNKNNITIAGESAGSSSISAICASPLAKNLFQKAIGESSSVVVSTPPHTFRTMEEALKMGNDIMEEFKCSSIDELRNISAEDLVRTRYANSQMTIDGYALPKSPYEIYQAGENNEVALLNGYNVKEADAFVVPTFLLSPTNKKNIKNRLIAYFGEETAEQIYNLYKDKINKDAFAAFNEIISVYWFIHPHHSWSNMARANGVDVYRYQFTKENGYYGTYHSGEMIYIYGNLYRSNHQFAYDQSDYDLQNMMVKYFTNFIKMGNPNQEGLPQWEKYTTNTSDVMELGKNVGMIDDEYLELYQIIDAFIIKEEQKN